jgi:hypothetical protein
MRTFVGGSLREVPQEEALCKEFVSALGSEIMKGGHVLLITIHGVLSLRMGGTA